MKKWIFGISIFFLLLVVSCTLNAKQEQAFSNQKSLYLNAVNDGSTLAVVSMTYPGFVAHVKKQGPEVFKATFAPGNPEEATELGGQIIQQTVRKGELIHILFEAEIQSYKDGITKKQFVGISSDDGENWFFMPYADYKNKQICKELPRLI